MRDNHIRGLAQAISTNNLEARDKFCQLRFITMIKAFQMSDQVGLYQAFNLTVESPASDTGTCTR